MLWHSDWIRGEEPNVAALLKEQEFPEDVIPTLVEYVTDDMDEDEPYMDEEDFEALQTWKTKWPFCLDEELPQKSHT